jgi:4-hydroxybenzoate polyprenyltransferase
MRWSSDDDVRVGIRRPPFCSATPIARGCGTTGVDVGTRATGVRLRFGIGCFLGIAVAGALFVYQQRLIRDRKPAHCFAAFRNNVWVGFALFAGTVTELEFGLRLPSIGGM